MVLLKDSLDVTLFFDDRQFVAHKTENRKTQVESMMKNKTQHTTKIGMKKKIDLIEPKHNKSRVVTEKKNPLKSEVIAQFKALQI